MAEKRGGKAYRANQIKQFARTPTAHEKHAAKVREQCQTCTPYRLGWAVGEAGDTLPSPYPPGTRGDHNYLDGMEQGRTYRTIDMKARQLYDASTANDPLIHCNRFPSWSELNGQQRWPWCEKAIEALAAPQEADANADAGEDTHA